METFAELCRFMLFGLGFTYLITRSVIMKPVRAIPLAMLKIRRLSPLAVVLAALLFCPSCSAFWIGLLIKSMWPWPGPWQWLESGVALCACGAFAASVWSDAAIQDELQVVGTAVNRMSERLDDEA